MPGKYQPAIEIRLASLRDLTYVADTMRPQDWREIGCQYKPGTARSTVGALLHEQATEAWAAWLQGQPVAVFGASGLNWTTLAIWAFGTRSMRRAVPAITRFIMEDRVPFWLEAGVTRCEARSISDHHEAHRWMRGMGARHVPCPGYGRDGEDFILFYWTADDVRWRQVKEDHDIGQHRVDGSGCRQFGVARRGGEEGIHAEVGGPRQGHC